VLCTGEYISVASQKDAEEADIEKERAEQRKGPAAQARELEELAAIYEEVGAVLGTAGGSSSSSSNNSSCSRSAGAV
jgi:VIT1/CCC1 family predicted Fe2+/Mn2+ transporter